MGTYAAHEHSVRNASSGDEAQRSYLVAYEEGEHSYDEMTALYKLMCAVSGNFDPSVVAARALAARRQAAASVEPGRQVERDTLLYHHCLFPSELPATFAMPARTDRCPVVLLIESFDEGAGYNSDGFSYLDRHTIEIECPVVATERGEVALVPVIVREDGFATHHPDYPALLTTRIGATPAPELPGVARTASGRTAKIVPTEEMSRIRTQTHAHR